MIRGEKEPTGRRDAETRDKGKAQDWQLLDAHEASWALWAALRTANEAEHVLARDLGLPYTDALALNHILSSTEPLGPVELGRRLGISSASATVLVDRLVERGHLTRRPNPADGRRCVLEATERAWTDAVKAMAPLLHALDAVAARLDDDATAAVVSYLRDVADVHRHYSASSRYRAR